MLTFTIAPPPPPINQTYRATSRGGRGQFYKNRAASDWLDGARYQLRAEYGDDPIRDTCSVALVFVFNTRRRDIDSGIKAALDALHPAVIADDRLIDELHVRRVVDPRGIERVEYQVMPHMRRLL